MRIVLAIAIVSALLAAGPAQGAQVGLHDDGLTNFAPGAPLEGRLDLLAGSGTRITRVDVLWHRIAPTRPATPRDPADPAYDWGQMDAIVRGLSARGILPILTFFSSPPWVSAAGVRSAAPRASDASRFAAALARRYSGEYAPAGEPPLPEARRIEVWNEPNLPFFFTPQCRRQGGRAVYTSPRRYAALLRASYREIKAVNPDAIVIGGVTGPASSTQRFCDGEAAVGALDFAAGLARERPPMDVYSQHVYPIGSPLLATFFPSWRTMGRLIRAVDRVRPGLPVYITETGYHTSYNRFHRYFVSEAQQAAWLDQTYRVANRRSRVELVVWFNLQDNPFWTGGLLRRDLSPKPASARFARWAGANPPPASWRR